MTDSTIATPALTEHGVTEQITAFLPAAMEQTLFSSGWDKTPRGHNTYSLTKPNDTMQLLFDDTTVYVVDPQTGYDEYGDPWWRTDIYRAAMTPAVKGWIILTQLPAWWDWDFSIKVLHSTHDTQHLIGDGRAGRFSTKQRVTDNEWGMLHMARVWHFPPSDITYEPEPRLVWSNRQSGISGRPVGLWTDGKLTTQEFYHRDHNYSGEISLTKAAAKLISIAVRQKYWRQHDRWKGLMLVASYETEVLKDTSRGGPGNYDEKRLEQLTTDTERVLYMVCEEGGYLGEDGDTWDHYALYEDLAAAEAAYNEIKL